MKDMPEYQADPIWAEVALRMLKTHGYQDARRRCARLRDENAWGTYSYAWYVQVGKQIERMAGSEDY